MTSPIELAVMGSFRKDVEAFKPGNISFYSSGHDMIASDFIRSAEVSTPILCRRDFSLGERILSSVNATQKAVSCNTNLGMILLFTPIIMAAEQGYENIEKLTANLENTLTLLTKDDVNKVFEAIRIANPGGLGSSDTNDVMKTPDCSLKQAMKQASQRDSVALQYSNNFSEVFNVGFETIKYFDKRWNSVKWSAVSCYLTFLSSMRDTHIERKYGSEIAEQIKIKSGIIVEKFNNSIDPKILLRFLKDFDRELKTKNYNPGTSADLTAASLLVYYLLKT